MVAAIVCNTALKWEKKKELRISRFKNWADKEKPEKEQSEQWGKRKRKIVFPKPRNQRFSRMKA